MDPLAAVVMPKEVTWCGVSRHLHADQPHPCRCDSTMHEECRSRRYLNGRSVVGYRRTDLVRVRDALLLIGIEVRAAATRFRRECRHLIPDEPASFIAGAGQCDAIGTESRLPRKLVTASATRGCGVSP